MSVRTYGGVIILVFLARAPAIAHAQGVEVALTPIQAVERALRYNLALQVDRHDPNLSTAPERVAAATFDPVLFGETTANRTPGTISIQRAGLAPVSATRGVGEVGVRKSFSTGTSFETQLTSSGLFGGRGGLDPAYQSSVSAGMRQALLKGASVEANEAAIYVARFSRHSAKSRLGRKAEVVGSDTLKAYWDLHAALSGIGIQEVALQMSLKTLDETMTLIAAGKLPAAEEPSARYQVQVQRRAKIGAEQATENARDRLARLIGLVGPRSLDTPRIVTAVRPQTDVPRTALRDLQKQALERRGDYRALASDLEAKSSQVRAARHLLLPKLDFVAGIVFQGLSGETPAGTPTIGVGSTYFQSYALQNIGWSAGLVLEYPIGNREAQARLEIAGLELARTRIEMERIEQTLSEELNVAWRAVRVAREQLDVTEAAVKLAEKKVANELERYRAGKTTAQILTLMQAELVKERLTREQAIADFNKALVDLWAASGTLLAQLVSPVS